MVYLKEKNEEREIEQRILSQREEIIFKEFLNKNVPYLIDILGINKANLQEILGLDDDDDDDTMPVTLSGNNEEVLYSNIGGTALTKAQGTINWGNDFRFTLSRAITADDDNKDMLFELQFINNTKQYNISRTFRASQFRQLKDHEETSGTAAPNAAIYWGGTRTRSSDPNTGLAGRVSMLARQRATGGNDIVRFLWTTDSSSQQHGAFSDVFARIVLVPTVANLTISNGGG